MIKVSIIIPVYNQEELIVRALDSIPDRDDIEVIVIDDCSTDGTLNIVKNYHRIKNLNIFHNDKNMGVGYSRNIGLDNAVGEYIYGIDSDDYVDIEKFNFVLDMLYKISYDIIYVWIKLNSGEMWGPGCTAFHTRFTKRSLIGNLRCPLKTYGEDTDLYHELLKLPATSCRLDKSLCFYNYNFPRVGSLDWINTH